METMVEKLTENIVRIQDWLPGHDLERPVIISGPCSAETEEQVVETCIRLAKTGHVNVLRAGIWKPRTRPGSFEGIGSVGLQWLKTAKQETGLPITTEVANVKHVYEALKAGVDILWIGARTTVNPFSVQEIADALKGVDIPVLIKNPVNPDLELWIGAIERIHQAGINRVGAIHRGFAKHGEKKFRNAPQWQLPIELMRRIPDLSIICDPSHICGNREGLAAITQEAMDLNYDGAMLESHIDPDNAWSDAKQQVVPERVGEIVSKLVLRDENASDPSLLQGYREKIDQLDDEIMNLFSQRMNISKDIGRYKKANGIAILQSKRWEDILTHMAEKGEKVGLSAEFVERYLKAVHQESINHQNQVMNEE